MKCRYLFKNAQKKKKIPKIRKSRKKCSTPKVPAIRQIIWKPSLALRHLRRSLQRRSLEFHNFPRQFDVVHLAQALDNVFRGQIRVTARLDLFRKPAELFLQSGLCRGEDHLIFDLGAARAPRDEQALVPFRAAVAAFQGDVVSVNGEADLVFGQPLGAEELAD